MNTLIGTNIFPSHAHAESYYSPYGYGRDEVRRKVEDGEIIIDHQAPRFYCGKPVKSAKLIDGSTRWQVEV